jgi:hypothetical protein
LVDIEYLRKTSPKTMAAAETTAGYLKGWDRLSALLYVTMHTIFLDLPKGVLPNSNLIVVGKGHGKGAFLEGIVRPSNPNHTIMVGDKSYESKLVRRPSSDFKDKLWLAEDLIVILEGMNRKQRAQWQGFFIKLLSTGTYDRDDEKHTAPIVGAWMSCIFGIAKERWYDFKGEFLGTTFLERLIPVYGHKDESVDASIRRATLSRREGQVSVPLPTVSLIPPSSGKVHVNVPKNISEKVYDISRRFEHRTGLSPARATNYILNFVQANAYINGRTEVTEDDIQLWEYVEDIHYPDAGSGKPLMIIRNHIRDINTTNVKTASNATGLSMDIVRNCLNELVANGEIDVHTGPHGLKTYSIKKTSKIETQSTTEPASVESTNNEYPKITSELSNNTDSTKANQTDNTEQRPEKPKSTKTETVDKKNQDNKQTEYNDKCGGSL